MKPFRFGVQVSQLGSASDWRDKARKIEDLGFSTLFMPDHFGQELAPLARDRDGGGAHHNPARRFAGVRQRLQAPGDPRQGSGDDRSACATVGSSSVSARVGCGPTTTSSACRTTRPRCASTASRKRCTSSSSASPDEKFSYPGEHYRITDYASWPEPVQKPGPPILIGGGGKRVLSIAAREADIVGVNPNLRAGEIGLDAAKDSLREQTDRKIQWIRDAAGARIDDIEIQMRFFVTSVRPDRMKLAEALAPTFGCTPEEALESGAALVGTEEEISEQLHRRREEWGLSYIVVGDDNVDEFAPIVAKLAGT